MRKAQVSTPLKPSSKLNQPTSQTSTPNKSYTPSKLMEQKRSFEEWLKIAADNV